jgi:hypothetical protein
MNLAWNMTQETQNGSSTPNFPGQDFSNQSAGYSTRNYSAGYGLDWQLTDNLINQFKLGFLYNVSRFSTGGAPLWATQPTVYWGLDSYGTGICLQTYSACHRVLSGIQCFDTMSWQKGATTKFGFHGTANRIITGTLTGFRITAWGWLR